jgi:hypothetical protein
MLDGMGRSWQLPGGSVTDPINATELAHIARELGADVL